MSNSVRSWPDGVEEVSDEVYLAIPPSLIDPNPRQPRKFFDNESLRALAASLQQIGQLEDILVRPRGSRFEIVLGERRWRACQIAALPTIKAKVRDLSDEQVLTIALAENVQREDLTGVEEAFAFKSYIDQGMTQAGVGEELGELHGRVSAKLRILSSSYYVEYLENELKSRVAELDELRRGNRTKCEVRAVNEADLLKLVAADWDYLDRLGDGRYLVRRGLT